MTERKRNLMGRTRAQDAPYLIYQSNDGWEWRVLKSWQTDNAKPYARWLCAVSSPMTYGGVDMGDVYVADVVRNGTLTFIDPELFVALNGSDVR